MKSWLNENLNESPESGSYKTSDLALAATLSLFHPIESVDKSQPQRVVFVFKRSHELDELVESYWGGSLSVEPQRYFSQLKNIKTRIYASR